MSETNSRYSMRLGEGYKRHPCLEGLHHFNMWNSLAICEREDDKAYCYYFIGSTQENAADFYLNNLELFNYYASIIRGRVDVFQKYLNPDKMTMQDLDRIFKPKPRSIDIPYKGRIVHLTRREIECIVLLSRGLCVKEIACKLELSARTVEDYIRSAKTKIGRDTRSGVTEFVNVVKLNNLA